MTVISQSLLMRALRGEPTVRPPVWLMRQAGRYLPEYRASRSKASDFMAMCKNPALACEVTLQPIERFGLDAAIIFSDILTIPHAMGMALQFYEGRGPVFSDPLRTLQSIQALKTPDVADDLSYVMEALRLTRQALPASIPLIGFSGSPWTLATYMVEGHGSKNFSLIKQMLYSSPAVLHHLLEKLSSVIAYYLAEQVQAGANVLMIFDSWGGVLSHQAYQEFSLSWMKKVIDHLRAICVDPAIPVIVFTKGGGQWLSTMASCGAQALGLDWTTPIGRARQELAGKNIALQGNLDPCVLFSSPHVIEKQVLEMIREYGPHPGLIVNCGHGLIPELNPDHVKIMVDTVKNFDGRY